MQPHDANQPYNGTPAGDSFPRPTGKPTPGGRVPNVLNSGPTPSNLFRCLQRRLVLALSLSLLLGTAAAATAWFVAPHPKHQVRTMIQVPVPVNEILNTNERRIDLVNHQRTQMAMAKSRMVLQAALRDQRVANTPLLAGMLDPVEWLEKEVQADFLVAPEVLRISMRGMEIDDLKLIVDAVRKAYQAEVLDKNSLTRRARMEIVRDLVTKYDNQLKESRDFQKKMESQGNGARDPRVRATLIAINQGRVSRLEGDSVDTRKKLREATIQFKAEKDRLANFEKEPLPEAAINQALTKHKGVLSLQADAEAIQQKIEEYVAVAAKGENDPGLKKYRAELKAVESKIISIKNSALPQVRKDVKEELRAKLETQVRALDVQIGLLTQNEKELEAELERNRATLTKLGQEGSNIDSVKEDITYLEEITKKLKHEQEALSVELLAAPKIPVLEEATLVRADPLMRKLLLTAGSGLAGILLALFGVAWLEYRSRRVDSVDEVVLGLGMRLVGTVPVAKAKGRKTTSKSDDVGHQVLTESVDAARTMLLHLARTHSLRTVMITSAVSGEGKTSLSCHLAASLARAGLRMLLIDGDMRNPTAHRLFGLPCDTGFCEVLTDKIDVNEGIKATSLRGLYLMPAGQWTDQAALALSQGKPAVIFDQLRQQFDLIIVDSSPVLPVADGLMIGQQVDGVLLSVLCQVSRLTNLYAAWQRIEQLGVHPLGVVINGVQANLYGSTYSYPYPRKKKSPPKPIVSAKKV